MKVIQYTNNITHLTLKIQKNGGLILSWGQIIDILIQKSSTNKVSSRYVLLGMGGDIYADPDSIKSLSEFNAEIILVFCLRKNWYFQPYLCKLFWKDPFCVEDLHYI